MTTKMGYTLIVTGIVGAIVAVMVELPKQSLNPIDAVSIGQGQASISQKAIIGKIGYGSALPSFLMQDERVEVYDLGYLSLTDAKPNLYQVVLVNGVE